jgi:hypothetical protein
MQQIYGTHAGKVKCWQRHKGAENVDFKLYVGLLLSGSTNLAVTISELGISHKIICLIM